MNFGTSTQTPNPQAMAAYQGVLNQAGNVNQIPYQMYQGQQIAGFSPDQLAAQQGVRESQGIALPFIDAASTAVGRAMEYADPNRFNQQEVSRYFNPYQQNVIDATMANMREMNASQQNQVTGNAIQHGYMGGDRAGVARAELARQQALTNNSTLAQLQHQGYQSSVDQWNKAQQQAIAAQQAGAYSFGALGTQAQNSVMQGLQALAASGAQQQGLQQQQLTADYENWQRAMGYPYQQTQWNAGITGAIAPNMGGTTTSMSMGENSKTEPGPSVGGQVAGLLTSGLSLLPKFGDGGRVGKEDGGALTYMTQDNPFDDPRRKWEEGQRAWMSANADEPPAPDAVMRAAGGSLADPLAKRESSPFGGGDAWIPGIELHPASPQFPAPAKAPDLDTGGGGGGGGDDLMGGLTKGLGALAGKIGHKAPMQLPSASHSSPTPEGATVAPPVHTADDEKFAGIYAGGGRVGYAEGGAPSVPTTGGNFGNLYSGWAARGAPTGVAGSSLMPSFEAPTQRPSLPTPPVAPGADGSGGPMGGMNPMMMMGGGKNSGMMMMLSMIQQQQAAAKYQQDMAKYNTDLAAAKSAPRPIVGYTAQSREYAIDPMTGLYGARGWTPSYAQLYADGGRVDELEGFDSRKFHPELTRERGSERGVSEMSLGDTDELMSAMQRRQQRTPRLRGGEIEDEDLTLNPVGRILPGAPTDYETRPIDTPLPPARRPQEFEQPAARPGVDIDRGLAALRAIESSGRYGITGPRSRTGDRPYGAYQVMGANIPSWGREAGYENLTPQQFLGSREIQDRVARVQYQKYLEKEGGNPEYAAANWIGGPGWRKHLGARDVLGTDAPEYMRRYRKAYASLGDGAPAASGGSDAVMAYAPTERAARHPGLGAIDDNFRNSRENGGVSRAPAAEERTGLGSMWSPEVQQGLMAAGLGMLASRSPHMGVAIGEGGLRGMQAYQAAKSGAGDAEYRRAQMEHLQTTTELAREKFAIEREALDRKRRALELINQPPPGDEPAAEPSVAPAPAAPVEVAPGGARPSPASSDKSWEGRPRYDYGAPREAGAPAPEKAATGAPMDVRPGAQRPAAEPTAPAGQPAAPAGDFKVPRAVENKLREYRHWTSMAAAQEDDDVRAAYAKKAEAAKFEYERGMAEAKDDYTRRFDREKYQTTEQRAKEEADLKRKQADPAYQEDLERSKVLAKAEAEHIRDTATAGRAARGAITTLNTLKELSGDLHFDAGPLSGPATAAKQALVQIGWADPKVTTANELFDSLANRTLKEQIGSLGAGISNADVQFMYKMVPTREKTVGGIREIVDYNTKIEQRKIDVAKFTRDWAKEHGNRLGPDYDEALEKWADEHPLFPEKAAAGAAQAGKEDAATAKQWKPGDRRTGVRNGKKVVGVMQPDGSWKIEDTQ